MRLGSENFWLGFGRVLGTSTCKRKGKRAIPLLYTLLYSTLFPISGSLGIIHLVFHDGNGSVRHCLSHLNSTYEHHIRVLTVLLTVGVGTGLTTYCIT